MDDIITHKFQLHNIFHLFLILLWLMAILKLPLILIGDSGRESSLPYLFILCAETLSNFLIRAENDGSITTVQIGSGPLRVNYLFFGDNSLLFLQC